MYGFSDEIMEFIGWRDTIIDLAAASFRSIRTLAALLFLSCVFIISALRTHSAMTLVNGLLADSNSSKVPAIKRDQI